MQLSMFPSREEPNIGFPNPALIPARARNYVRLRGVLFRRDKLTIGSNKEMWWAIQEHSVLFEVTPCEAKRVPTFERQADMEAYVGRLAAFESNQELAQA